MHIYARVLIKDGSSVRLTDGNVNESIVLDDDPIGRALRWQEWGADLIHLVDLNAAAYGDYVNRPLVDRLVEQVSLPVQVAGGIRSEIEAKRLIEIGAYRVVMGTAAIENQIMVWDLCREHPGKIVVSLDVRLDGELAVRGWTTNSGRFLEEVLVEMSSAGAAAFLIAEAGRDALKQPPELKILKEALGVVREPVIAAGGVRHLADLADLLSLNVDGQGIAGVIVGREVTQKRFTIDEAKQLITTGPPPSTIGEATAVSPSSSHQIRLADLYRQVASQSERAANTARQLARRVTYQGVSGTVTPETVASHLHKALTMLSDTKQLNQDQSE